MEAMTEPTGADTSASGPIEDLAEAFLERWRKGERPSISEYAERHPELADEIQKVFPALVLMERAGERASTQALSPGAGAGTAATPERIGRYEVLGRHREGGMGVIYLGRDPDLGRTVVLKTIRPSLVASAQALERFKREVRISGRLDHPGICPVLDIVSEGGRDFVVMPFIEGESLSESIERARKLEEAGGEAGSGWLAVAHPSPESEEGGQWPRAASAQVSASARPGAERTPSRGDGGDLRGLLRLVENTARAIHCAHEAGIVHRDLKPGNILIRPNGEPVVLDFGLALDRESGDHRLTEEGEILGTPVYMAPEQVEGRVSLIDRRTDVYALGVILYEILTLRCPYEGRSRAALFQKILKGDPVRPRKHRKAIPADLDAVCLMAMALEPERRYGTALDFAEDLRRVRTLRPTVAKPPSTLGRIWRRARRSPIVAGALAASVVLGVVAIGLGLESAAWMSRYVDTSRTAALQASAAKTLLSISRGEEPPKEDLTMLAQLLPDEAARVKFLTNPFARESWDHLESSLEDLPRGVADVDAGSYRLLEPRAAVASPHPVFRFEVPDAGGDEWRYRLTISSEGAEDRMYEVVQGPGEKGPLVFTLPPAEPLEAGREYTWKVGLDPERHREWTAHYAPLPARFKAMGPRVPEEVLKAIRPTGRVAMDRLLAAAALVAHQFAVDALERLEVFPPDATREEKQLRAFLRAEALGLLGDEDGLRAAVEELEEGIAPDG
jgi:serine/threonine protein kinase